MPGFTKLFSDILRSSVWSESVEIRIVWITMLAMADRNGNVFSSVPGLAKEAGVGIEVAVEAVNRFLSPDPYSRSKEHEGRRIEEIQGGWRLLNYLRYRERRDSEETRIGNAQRQRRYRQRHAVTRPRNSNASVTGEVTGAVTDRYSDAKAEDRSQKTEEIPGVAGATPSLASDPKKKPKLHPTPPTPDEIEVYHRMFEPDRDVSTEAAEFVDFWTSVGWKRKSGPIVDWKATWRNWVRRLQKEGRL